MIIRSRYVIAVTDLARSEQYYRDILGFDVYEVGDPGWRFFLSGAGLYLRFAHLVHGLRPVPSFPRKRESTIVR